MVMVAPDAIPAARAIRGAIEVGSLAALRAALVAVAPPGPSSLDLYAHATRGHHHLRLGRDVVDVLAPDVAAWFADLVAAGVLARSGVAQIRLLGCATAVGPAARASLTRLARITGCAVVGTRKPLLAPHHGPDGLRPAFAHLLEAFVPASWAARLITPRSG